MELYIGGYAQGKLNYVQSICPEGVVLEPEVAEGVLDLAEGISDLTEGTSNLTEGISDPAQGDMTLVSAARGEESSIFIFNKFHLTVRKLLSRGWNQENITKALFALENHCEKVIVISDEIGCGIVPMEKEERLWREENGRILCLIAAKAEKVERIICGIPERIK